MMGMTFMILAVTAVCCSLIGAFLVLRNLSMVSDAISHSVLLGIVLAFFVTHDIDSPLLVVGAAAFGLITVFAIESLSATGLVKNDDAVGIVFPLFFAIAVILITKFARNVHIDTDVVLMGEVILAPLNRLDFLGHSLPKALVYMGIMLLINISFILIFFKELKVTTFDEDFATLAGFSSITLFYVLMTLSSLTAVIAFDAVGAILVVSFLITPGATAYMVTKSLKSMLMVTVLYAIVNSFLGYYFGIKFNVSMSGMTATAAGVTFLLTWLFNPNGLITLIVTRRKNRHLMTHYSMLMHIGNHDGFDDEQEELGFDSIYNHLNWTIKEVDRSASWLKEKGYIFKNQEKQTYDLTEAGREKYHELLEEYGA